MNFSREIQEKINRFVKDQSQNYLQDAEMTYMEKLRRKTGQTKRKVGTKLARFKGQSNKGLEAQNDMLLYMSDYMNDLMSQGLSEQQAFDKASEEMKFASDTEQATDLSERFQQYYQNRDPASDEAIGLFYASFPTLGLIIGGLIGYLASGGRTMFLSGGWIDTLIGIAVGILVGAALGMMSHGAIALKNRK